ncbi:MAG: hypothetical protein GY765_41700 [bacterium]|nr:hypothetical protein [bacterium]
MKTAGRILGTAFFFEGYEVQDAPRYGAERRGAPMFSSVRVSRDTINERGQVHVPDLVVSADSSLLSMPAAGVFTGCSPSTVLLVEASASFNVEETISGFDGNLITLNISDIQNNQLKNSFFSSLWAGAAAKLCGVVSKESLEKAVHEELGHLGNEIVATNLESAFAGWYLMEEHKGIVNEGVAHPQIKEEAPAWIDLKHDPVHISAPVIRNTETSKNIKTGSWRTSRPVIDYSKCKQCWWNCSVFCPDSAITINAEGFPVINYDHCKGCLICASQCGGKAIGVQSETEAAIIEKGEDK